MFDLIIDFINSVIRMATPLIFVAICSNLSEQAGLLNMASESMMLSAALGGVMISAFFQNAWLGVLGGAGVAVLITLLLCFAAFVMKVDLYLMSISLNMALTAGTVFFMYIATGSKATTAGAIQSKSLGDLHIPFIEDIPILGDIISGQNIFTYLAIIFTILVWVLLFKTKLGLRMRAVGQNPLAAESVGINPRVIYTVAFAIAGFVAAFGGMYLSMGYQSFFARNLTAGRGFVGLAASSIANAQPILSAVIALLFGIAYASTNYLKPFIADQYMLTSVPFVLIIILYFVMAGYRTWEKSHAEKKKVKQLQAMTETVETAEAVE